MVAMHQSVSALQHCSGISPGSQRRSPTQEQGPLHHLLQSAALANAAEHSCLPGTQHRLPAASCDATCACMRRLSIGTPAV